ncbi:putative het-domain-containing protein [Neofusicoccum parvum UCRNP2]|uniref:Putative het-domain-containing protein n=1 Tax=Botryosphaeria parva (strain UCR-NP2) TaxID=1287680 RepID=R1GJM2_BOTPV|nr:putative het-domain-containing protein [Neofusicoccum parvum UCRNP2]
MPDRPALARTQTTRPCKLCNNLDPRSHPATYHDQESTTRSIASLTLQLDPVRLKRSHENCPRCRLLADALDAHFEGWRKTKPRLLLELVECAPVRLEVQRDGTEGVKIEIYAPPAIEDCLKNHQHRLCGQSRRDLFVPSRLIYVGKDPGSTEHIKLCQVPANKVKYISLSHCWGNGPTFTTTTANLAERKRHIDFDSMPQSFQDAVTITQELGVR